MSEFGASVEQANELRNKLCEIFVSAISANFAIDCKKAVKYAHIKRADK